MQRRKSSSASTDRTCRAGNQEPIRMFPVKTVKWGGWELAASQKLGLETPAELEPCKRESGMAAFQTPSAFSDKCIRTCQGGSPSAVSPIQHGNPDP